MTQPRRLCLLFEAHGGTRFAIEAVDVLEVIEARDDLQPKRSAEVRSWESLIGPLGKQAQTSEYLAPHRVFVDTTPPFALHADAVAGVLDTAKAEVLPIAETLRRRIAPLVRQVLVMNGKLHLELECEAMATAKPGTPTLIAGAIATTRSAASALVFRRGASTFAIDVANVLRVVPHNERYTPIAGQGACIGVIAAENAGCPVISIHDDSPFEMFVIAKGSAGPVAFAATMVEGVRPSAALNAVQFIDVDHVFS